MKQSSTSIWSELAGIAALGVAALVGARNVPIDPIRIPDEGLYVSSPLRYVLGDMPIRDEVFNCLFMFDLVLWPLYAAFPDLALIHMRWLGWAMALAGMVAVYALFRRFAPPYLVGIACLAVAFAPKTRFFSPGYNSMAAFFLCAATALWLGAATSRPGKRRLAMASVGGILLALGTISYTPLAAVAGIPACALVYWVATNRRSANSVGPTFAYLVSYTIALAAFVGTVVAAGLGDDWLHNVDLMRGTPGHGHTIAEKIGIIFTEFSPTIPYLFGLEGLMVFAALAVSRAPERLRNPIVAAAAIVCAVIVAVQISATPDLWFRSARHHVHTMLITASLGIAVLGTILVLLRRTPDDSTEDHPWLVPLAALFCGLLFLGLESAASSNGIINARFALGLVLPAAVAASVPRRDENGDRVGFGVPAPILAAVCIVLAGYHLREHVKDDVGLVPYESPKLAGIKGEFNAVTSLDEATAFLSERVEKGDFLLADDHLPLFYFLTDTRPALNSTWMTVRLSESHQQQALDYMKSEGRLPEFAVRSRLGNEMDLPGAIHAFIEANYYPVFESGIFSIWQSRFSFDPVQTSDDKPQLVLLYATCTVNADYLDPYGPNYGLTPNIARFAESSAVMTKHRTEAGLSGVSYASLFTSRQAPEHGVYVHPKKLDPNIYDVSEALADNGYAVYYFDGHRMARRNLGYLQATTNQGHIDGALYRHTETFDALLDRLATIPSTRAAVITTFYVTHGPYRPDDFDRFIAENPDQWSARYTKPLPLEQIAKYNEVYRKKQYQLKYGYDFAIRELGYTVEQEQQLARVVELFYRKNIKRLDNLFGETLKTIEAHGLLDDSVILFTADHGETLWAENAPFKWCHGHTLRRDVIDVPFIVYGPRWGVVADTYPYVTRSIDVAPTLAGVLDLELPDETRWRGENLADTLRGEEPFPELLAFSHSATIPERLRGASPDEIGRTRAARYPTHDVSLIWVAVREADLVVQYGDFDGDGFRYRAYDVAADPGETIDIFDESLARHARLANELQRYREDLIASYDKHYRDGEPTETVDDDEEALRSLGYIQ